MDEPRCPYCYGELKLLGRLGRVTWYRCRHCGTDWSQATTEEQDA